MLRFVHALVFALAASFGIASGAHALGSETALRKISESAAHRVGALAPEALVTRQQNSSHATTVASECSHAARGAGQASNVLLRTGSQLASKFKHAKDFGVVGNYSKANAGQFSRAIHQHINSPAVRAIEGTYHKAPVTHYLDPSSGLNVMADGAGNFISGWKLSPAQLQNVLTHGGL